MQRLSPRLNPLLGDRGSASLIAAAMIAALAVVTVGGAHVGAAVIARHRAQAAADLAALAGAAYLPAGADTACAQAAVLARAMGTIALTCAAEGLDLVVTVEASTAVGPAWMGAARAVARAGPIDVARVGP
ncbi:MAG: Rv3654c family TadE-like protein [Mycobacterium sp.]